MTHSVEFYRLTSPHHPHFDALFSIYRDALPVSEQKPLQHLSDMVARDDYLFLTLQSQQQVLGFAIAYVSKQSPFYLLEYMAIASSQRSRGYGATLYQALKAQVNSLSGGPRTAVIEVDSPDEASLDHHQRRRRVDFYRRCGASVVEGVDYLLPLETGETPPAMWLMLDVSGSQPVHANVLCDWLTDIFDKVYRQPGNDERLLKMHHQLMES